MSETRIVAVVARERDINARGRGLDTYAMVGLPGTQALVWVDRVPGAEVRKDDYPRSRGIRAAERGGSQIVRVPLPVGSIIVYIEKRTDRRVERWAVRVTEDGGELTSDGEAVRASTLPKVPVVSRRAQDGSWLTVLDGVEYR